MRHNNTRQFLTEGSPHLVPRGQGKLCSTLIYKNANSSRKKNKKVLSFTFHTMDAHHTPFHILDRKRIFGKQPRSASMRRRKKKNTHIYTYTYIIFIIFSHVYSYGYSETARCKKYIYTHAFPYYERKTNSDSLSHMMATHEALR